MTTDAKKPFAYLADEVKAGLDYSRNFATAKPNIGSAEKEHILGLCNLLERLLAEHGQYCRMFHWATHDLCAVGEALGIPGEEQKGGAAEFIEAIEQLRAVQQQVIPTGYVLVPTQMHLDKEVIETLLFHVGRSGVDDEYVDGILWVGETSDDEGNKAYGLNIACAECPEEGSSMLIELDEVSPPLRHIEPQNIPAAKAAAAQEQAEQLTTNRLEELKDVVHALIVQFTMAGIKAEKDSIDPLSSLLYRAEQALQSDGSLVTAQHDEITLLKMEISRLAASKKQAEVRALRGDA